MTTLRILLTLAIQIVLLLAMLLIPLGLALLLGWGLSALLRFSLAAASGLALGAGGLLLLFRLTTLLERIEALLRIDEGNSEEEVEGVHDRRDGALRWHLPRRRPEGRDVHR